LQVVACNYTPDIGNVLLHATVYCHLQQRLEIESKAKEALESLTGELKGTYYPLTDMDAATQKQLTDEHFLFNDHDR
jgi:hypothetical protein